MRILHTSDWHLGRTFGTQPLLADQRRFLEWLLGEVRQHGVELVVVAGDIFDRAVPPVDAIEVWRGFLRDLGQAGVPIVAIAGNHDQAVRLAAHDGLTDAAGVWIRGGHERAGEVLEITASDGPLTVVPVPFLDPMLSRSLVETARETADGGPPGNEDSEDGPRPTHESVLRAALDRARALVAGRRSLALSHAWVQGGEQSESERMLTVGGAGQVDVSLFDGFSYVALGHLHRPQLVGGRPNLRYSGSPLPYSFSEEHGKEVVLLDMDPTGRVETRALPVPVGRAVATIRGTIEELLSSPDHEPARDRWVHARLTDRGVVLEARQRLQTRFPHIVDVTFEAGAGDSSLSSIAEGLETKNPFDLAVEFWKVAVKEDPDGPTRELLRAALEEATRAREQS